MALFSKLSAGFGCAALAFSLPMLAAANQGLDMVEATHFVSSGRVVNVVAHANADDQAEARAAVWALTQQSQMSDCAATGAAQAACFETFRTGSK